MITYADLSAEQRAIFDASPVWWTEAERLAAAAYDERAWRAQQQKAATPPTMPATDVRALVHAVIAKSWGSPDSMAASIGDAIKAAVDPLVSEIDRLRREVSTAVLKAEAAAAKATEHQGVWRPDVTYEKNDLVTFDSDWYKAACRTTAKPRESREWTMVLRNLSRPPRHR